MFQFLFLFVFCFFLLLFSFNEFLKADDLQTLSLSRDTFFHLKSVQEEFIALVRNIYTHKCTLSRGFNSQECSKKNERPCLLLFARLSNFSDLDLGNLDFWGSIYVFNSNSFWKQVSLSVMTTVLEKDFFFVGQQKKAASASQFPPAV